MDFDWMGCMKPPGFQLSMSSLFRILVIFSMFFALLSHITLIGFATIIVITALMGAQLGDSKRKQPIRFSVYAIVCLLLCEWTIVIGQIVIKYSRHAGNQPFFEDGIFFDLFVKTFLTVTVFLGPPCVCVAVIVGMLYQFVRRGLKLKVDTHQMPTATIVPNPDSDTNTYQQRHIAI